MGNTEHYATPCEVVTRWDGGRIAEQCGQPSSWRYAAMSGGYMHLCAYHGRKHAAYAEHVTSGPGWMLTTNQPITPRIPSPNAKTTGRKRRPRRLTPEQHETLRANGRRLAEWNRQHRAR